MRILLDNCVNHRFAQHLKSANVAHARELGWGSLSNGLLMTAAEEAGFDVLLTVDKILRKQQNLAGRRITLLYSRHQVDSAGRRHPTHRPH